MPISPARFASIGLLGFSSGLPLALTGATLGVWLADAKVSLTSIGFFYLATVAYNVKVLWAPLLDRAALPVLTCLLGRRRSWALAIQGALLASILGLGASDPQTNLIGTAAWAVLVAFFSASQDVVIDAFRVEYLTEPEQAGGAAATQFGYRIGMLVAGAGALYAAEAWGWRAAYDLMAGLVLVGAITVLCLREPGQSTDAGDTTPNAVAGFLAPFRDFARHEGWVIILLFVLLYNLNDAMAGHMAGPLYIRLGFTKSEIASVSKVFGLVATLGGVALGAYVAGRIGVFRALLGLGLVKLAANLFYVVQVQAGHDLAVLAVTVAAENFAAGAASSAFLAYLATLCTAGHTATQFALLSAVATLGRTVLSSGSGLLVDLWGWSPFFILSAALGLPALALLWHMMRRAGSLQRDSVPSAAV